MSAAHSNEQAEGCTLFRAVERDWLGSTPVFIPLLLRSDVDRHVYLVNLFSIGKKNYRPRFLIDLFLIILIDDFFLLFFF